MFSAFIYLKNYIAIQEIEINYIIEILSRHSKGGLLRQKETIANCVKTNVISV